MSKVVKSVTNTFQDIIGVDTAEETARKQALAEQNAAAAAQAQSASQAAAQAQEAANQKAAAEAAAAAQAAQRLAQERQDGLVASREAEAATAESKRRASRARGGKRGLLTFMESGDSGVSGGLSQLGSRLGGGA
jgi:membrane protein involved in colicin uptake